jgi:hypothetical protein
MAGRNNGKQVDDPLPSPHVFTYLNLYLFQSPATTSYTILSFTIRISQDDRLQTYKSLQDTSQHPSRIDTTTTAKHTTQPIMNNDSMFGILSWILAQLSSFYLLINTTQPRSQTNNASTPSPPSTPTNAPHPSTQTRLQLHPHVLRKRRTPNTHRPSCNTIPKMHEVPSAGIQCATM